jgi:hypothetical protein
MVLQKDFTLVFSSMQVTTVHAERMLRRASVTYVQQVRLHIASLRLHHCNLCSAVLLTRFMPCSAGCSFSSLAFALQQQQQQQVVHNEALALYEREQRG